MDQYRRAALGPGEHRTVRRGPTQRHDRRAIGRRPVGARPAGLASLAWAVRAGDRESGAFALTQQPLADAEAAGEAFAAKAGCPDQSAQCLRHLPVADLVNNFPGAAIPGVIDGKILTESIGTALAAGRFAHVPILDGINHNEELIFVAGLHVAVSGGTFVPIPDEPVNADSYQPDIAAVLGVSAERAAAIAGEYPLAAYPSPDVALSTLVSDANFACPALQVDRWTSEHVPTFAYQFNDDNAPERFAPLPPAATHSSELQYIFDQPNTPSPACSTATSRRSPPACAQRGRALQPTATRPPPRSGGHRSTKVSR